jgi:CHAD domain-containing protein
LTAVVATLDEPWRGVLEHQRRVLDVLQTTTAELSDEATRVARVSVRRHRELLQVVSGPSEPLVQGFGAKSALSRTAPLLVDRSA